MTKRQSELFPELPSDKKYVSDYPELVAEWHPTKNGGKIQTIIVMALEKKSGGNVILVMNGTQHHSTE